MGLGFSQSLLHRRRTRLLGGDTQRKLMSSTASLKMPSGKEAVYSFNLVGGTGRIFLIWALFFEPFPKPE